MKAKIIGIVVLVFIAITSLLVVTNLRLKRMTQKYENAMANLKAYEEELSTEKDKSTAFQLTAAQLKYSKDSVMQELDATRRELKIKDKNLKALQAIQSEFSKKDTIRITQVDTLFKEPSLSLDTLLGDEWYSLRLGLRYPSTIITDPSFTSDKHIVVSTKKETVEPPKKFFLLRWFQKKHIVLDVNVKEKNPYVQNETSKYVEILK